MKIAARLQFSYLIFLPDSPFLQTPYLPFLLLIKRSAWDEMLRQILRVHNLLSSQVASIWIRRPWRFNRCLYLLVLVVKAAQTPAFLVSRWYTGNRMSWWGETHRYLWGLSISHRESKNGSAHGCLRETVHNDSGVTDPWKSEGGCGEPGSWAVALGAADQVFSRGRALLSWLHSCPLSFFTKGSASNRLFF